MYVWIWPPLPPRHQRDAGDNPPERVRPEVIPRHSEPILKRLIRTAVLGALPTAAAWSQDPGLQPPGTYQIAGRVRLQEPVVSIRGISNAQQISWTPGSLATPVATFSSLSTSTGPGEMPAIPVTGGRLEAMRIMPLAFV